MIALEMKCVLCKEPASHVDEGGVCESCLQWCDTWDAKFAVSGIGGLCLRDFILDLVINPMSAEEVGSICRALSEVHR